jgi:hypothetical protein
LTDLSVCGAIGVKFRKERKGKEERERKRGNERRI